LAWLAVLFFLILIGCLEPRELHQRGTGIVFLVPAWLAVAALLTIIAGTSLVGDHRRGFLDLVLITPLDPRDVIDGTLLSLWEHVRRIYWLPCVLALFFVCTGSVTAPGAWCSIITATLFGAVLAVHGTACSLTAKTLPAALVPTFLFPALMNIGIVFFILIFRHASGPVLWVVTAAFLILTWLWVRRKTSAAAVGSYFMAAHLALVCLATCWAVESGREEYPIVLMNPAFLTIQPLDGEPQNWFRGLVSRSLWQHPLVCYWGCLIVNFVWARRWLIRHFERLVQRTHRPMQTSSEPDALAWASPARRARVKSRTPV
jgi:hypothetical protein